MLCHFALRSLFTAICEIALRVGTREIQLSVVDVQRYACHYQIELLFESINVSS